MPRKSIEALQSNSAGLSSIQSVDINPLDSRKLAASAKAYDISHDLYPCLSDSISMRSVKVCNVSLGASEQDIKDFFSFSGDIEYVELQSENERSQTAYVTFNDVQGAETAVLLSGATIVDQSVTIALAPDYKPPAAASVSHIVKPNKSNAGAGSAVAEDVITTMLAKGFVLGKDALSKVKAFDDKHQLTSTASARVALLDQKIGLSDKFSMGTTLVSDKVREMDQKFQVSEKTKTAFAAAGQTVSNTGSAIMKNRYILTGASWVTGAFSRVGKSAAEVGQKTKEKVAEEERGRHATEGYTQIHDSSAQRAATG
ncbi:hypothetical protein Nepgr_031372 [Nepenthes gracilis]|uniref:RRM domain-containing protein n=1 Tax=Nepenthes gracilis TaxID=150966 RepID=A0AAD3TI02_NEPGR|nr:hypothetical protein Nepgr_031372 [Nepenthes gracilis]